MNSFEQASSNSLGVIAVAACLGLGAGCDGKDGDVPPPPPARGRSEIVTDDRPSTVGPAASAASSRAGGKAVGEARRKKPLCEGQKPRSGPEGKLETRAAKGGTPPDAELPLGVGKWVWLNFWAAWCKPCKEEMPRILAWQKKLQSNGVKLEVAFVSLDDDERQMQRFLDKQPAEGVTASYFLADGEPREKFLSSLGEEGVPQLPLHALVAPSGDVTCMIRGAVEDSDYETLAKFFGSSP